MKTMRIRGIGWALAGMLALTGLAGCGTTTGAGGGGSGSAPAEKWHNFDQGRVGNAEQNWASVVFVRENNALSGAATNVFVNGEYLASLLPGAFKQSIACVGNNRFTVRHTDVSSQYFEKEREGQYFEVPAGVVSYFRVVADAKGMPALAPLDPKDGQALVGKMKEQVHTLPRVDNRKTCAAPAQLKKYALQASALFAFDKADYANLLPQGKEEIRKVAADILQNKAAISKIDVIGYTDPQGTPAYNQQLSSQRALTVKQALAESGLPADVIEPQGRGQQDLLVNDCRARYPGASGRDERNACNQPNRRVEIVLHGRSAQGDKN